MNPNIKMPSLKDKIIKEVEELKQKEKSKKIRGSSRPSSKKVIKNKEKYGKGKKKK